MLFIVVHFLVDDSLSSSQCHGTTLNNIMNPDKKSTAKVSKGRTGWCVIFRHPLRQGPGNQKLRIRRGLGTTDRDEAQKLVDQLTEILQEPEYWNPAARAKADAKYDVRIVAAFFDYIEPERIDPWEDRGGVIPLPTRNEGFATVLMTGTTGSGKTTLGRQILGTDPETERFPSTSAAKTTICDFEIIMSDGNFAAAVSFLPKDQIRQYVADNVAAAVATCFEAGAENEITRRFMEHAEQRFRLSYILGDIEELDDEESDGQPIGVESADLPDAERKAMSDKLKGWIERIKGLAKAITGKLETELGQEIGNLTVEDRNAFEELVEAELLKSEEFHDLVDEILEEVEDRFALLKDGEIDRHGDGWPKLWRWESDKREKFLRVINGFCSNYAPLFGHLLTPLVEGIRVKGPFKPLQSHDGVPKLVLLDGQGIGHTADSASSVSTGITKRFQFSDLIVLVDNAEQPMQAASSAVLNSLVASGHAAKLAVAFTHFDGVTGDNLGSVRARKNHVLSSYDNAVHAVGKNLGRDAENSLRRLAPDRIFFFSHIEKTLQPENKLTIASLKGLIALAEEAIRPPTPAAFHPVYDVANLILAVERAAREFHLRWKGILGLASVAGVSAEHWTRVKALTRRVAHFQRDEYDTLRPVADLIRLLQKHISDFLSVPLSWTPSEPGADQQEKRAEALDTIRQEVFGRLHTLSTERLVQQHLADWASAYEHRGTGSTRERAKDIRSLYESGAPMPAAMPGADANKFLFQIRGLVRESITINGGSVLGWGLEAEADVLTR